MTKREFDLLSFLVKNHDVAVHRQLIIEQVWGPYFNGEYKVIDIYIKKLRDKLEEDPSHPKMITTIRGVGYRFEGKLSVNRCLTRVEGCVSGQAGPSLR